MRATHCTRRRANFDAARARFAKVDERRTEGAGGTFRARVTRRHRQFAAAVDSLSRTFARDCIGNLAPLTSDEQ